ncbi:MAG TPA: cell envelope integrity protein TolA [Burkholderiaceae bacterium]
MTAFSLHHHHDPLRPPEAPGLGRGVAFAVVAHILLLVALKFGVHWHTQTPPAFEAELWSAVPQAAAPKAEEPTPEPQPEQVKPQPPQPDPQEVQAQRDADIAITKAKEKKKREDDAAAAEAKKQKDLKALKDKQAADEKQKLLDKQKQEQKDKLDKQKAVKDAEAKREALRQDNLRRMMGMAGASGSPSATGTALHSSGPSSTYAGRIAAVLRSNVIYNGTPTGNPRAEIEVRVGADGSIIGRKLIKTSGDPEWDAAVLRAVDRTVKIPRDVDGSVQSLMVVGLSWN